MIPAPKGRYPPAEHYRLNNKDRLGYQHSTFHSESTRIIGLLQVERLCILPSQQDRATTGMSLPAPRRATTLEPEVAGA
jgi:hypothetical protein